MNPPVLSEVEWPVLSLPVLSNVEVSKGKIPKPQHFYKSQPRKVPKENTKYELRTIPCP
jgi:hypothetical protein